MGVEPRPAREDKVAASLGGLTALDTGRARSTVSARQLCSSVRRNMCFDFGGHRPTFGCVGPVVQGLIKLYPVDPRSSPERICRREGGGHLKWGGSNPSR